MEKLHTQENGGYLTLFSCLLFVVIAGLLLLCMDGILAYQGKAKSTMLQMGVSEHLLANYDKALQRRYDLFVMDPRLEESLDTRATSYYEEILNPSTAYFGMEHLLNLRLKKLEIESFGTMQEQECRYFVTQIKECIKYNATRDVLLQMFQGTIQKTENQNEQVENMVDMLDQKEAAVENEIADAPNTSKPATQEQTVDSAQKSDPLKTIKSIWKQGVLTYVMDGKEVSNRTISPSNLPSGAVKENIIDVTRKVFGGIDDFKKILKESQIEEIAGGVTDKGTLAIYTEQYFNYYSKEKCIDDTELSYEMEYVLGGRCSDVENMEYVVNRLLLLRFGVNAVYVFADEALNAQALSASVALVGATGSPAVIEAVKYTILSAISLLDAVEDVKDLFAGGKIPLLKRAADGEGITYDKYLMILFLLQPDQERQMLRMQDIMQLNVAREEPGFLMENCSTGLKIETALIQKFHILPGEHHISHEEKYTY